MLTIHCLYLKKDNIDYLNQVKKDTESSKYPVSFLEGNPKSLGLGRANAYRHSTSKYVSYIDSDDRIFPEIFIELVGLLENNPKVPFVWAGEQKVNQLLEPLQSPNIKISSYCKTHHFKVATYVHGLVVFRRDIIKEGLNIIASSGQYADWATSLFSVLYGEKLGYTSLPLHLPKIGRLWRIHSNNTHAQLNKSNDRKNMLNLLEAYK